MKKNGSVGIVTVILCLIALFIPTFIAIGAYIAGPSEEYEKKKSEITSLSITDTKGVEYTYGADEKGESMISLFSDIFDSSTKVTALSDSARNTPAFVVKTSSDGGEKKFRFYFNTKGASYYEDSYGKAFGIPEEKCAEFYSTECAMCLFLNTAAPTLKNAFGETILPAEMSWKYLAYDGKYTDSTTSTSTEVHTVDLDGAFSLSFDVAPDYTKVILYNGEVVVYDGALDGISSGVTVKEDTQFRMELEAKWYEDASRDYCGSAKYIFSANVSAQANFTLGKNSVEAGQIAVINASNIQDPSLIKVTFTPALKYDLKDITPVFYGNGGVYSALIPIPSTCFTDNAQSAKTMKYQIDISYGDASYTLNLEVADRTNVSTKNGDASEADANAARTETALSTFSSLLSETAAKSSAGKLWTSKTFYSYYNDKYRFSLAFGRNWQLANGEKYENEFIHYIMKSKTDILAVNSGAVVAVGENDLLGKYVAIDHGMGLQSWYFHLDSISVSVGDKVLHKQKIAKSGATGFVENSDIGFSMMFTVYGVPVCPYAQNSGEGLEETGLDITAFAS